MPRQEPRLRGELLTNIGDEWQTLVTLKGLDGLSLNPFEEQEGDTAASLSSMDVLAVLHVDSASPRSPRSLSESFDRSLPTASRSATRLLEGESVSESSSVSAVSSLIASSPESHKSATEMERRVFCFGARPSCETRRVSDFFFDMSFILTASTVQVFSS